MKHLSLLLLTFFLASCQNAEEQNSGCDASNETCLFDISEYGYEVDGDLPNEALTFDTHLSLANFDSRQQDKITQAAELIKAVVGSTEFRDAILNHTYNGQKTFLENGGLSNSQIYQRILRGAEKLTPAPNNALDAELELYFEESSTVGYTTPATKRIFMNTKFYNTYSPAQVAGNLTHEWLHKLGFGHSTTNSPTRPFTVPYAIGYLMTRLATQHL